MAVAGKGSTVKFSYRLVLDNGSVVETSDTNGPLSFTIGEGKVLDALEQGVVGMAVGESRVVEVPMEKAFGPRKEERVFPLPKSKAPSHYAVGKTVELFRADGMKMSVKIVGQDEETFTMDGNHPLAGYGLTFELKLLSVE